MQTNAHIWQKLKEIENMVAMIGDVVTAIAGDTKESRALKEIWEELEWD